MARRFNKDMDKYLKTRKATRPRARARIEVVPDDVEVYEGERPGFWARLFGPKQQIPANELTEEEKARLDMMEEEIEEIDEAEEDATDPEAIETLEEAREGVLERFFQSLRLFRRRHEVDERMEEVLEAEDEIEMLRTEMEAEFKEAMKISHKWLGKLSKRYKDDFKKSDDYKRYRELLRKYKVAK